jgi:hypothetical protein
MKTIPATTLPDDARAFCESSEYVQVVLLKRPRAMPPIGRPQPSPRLGSKTTELILCLAFGLLAASLMGIGLASVADAMLTGLERHDDIFPAAGGRWSGRP